VLRPETRVRARALQLLYAWDAQGRPSMERVVSGVLRGNPAWIATAEGAEQLAQRVASVADRLDRRIAESVENWRLDRLGLVEQNILRLGLFELEGGKVPPKVAINEAVQLAHWFAGDRAPAFVNGVLDALARRAGWL
jgi:N utilization substance protein B